MKFVKTKVLTVAGWLQCNSWWQMDCGEFANIYQWNSWQRSRFNIWRKHV